MLNWCLSCHYFYCLTAFPLFLHSLAFLIINCLSLLFETKEGSRRKAKHRVAFVPRRAPQGPAWLQ